MNICLFKIALFTTDEDYVKLEFTIPLTSTDKDCGCYFESLDICHGLQFEKA